MTVEMPASDRAAHRLVAGVLNRMAITEMAYHDFDHSRPLVNDLIGALTGLVVPGARLLLIGGNSLLAQVLVTAGYQLDIWRIGQNVLADELSEQIVGRLEPEALASGQLPFAGKHFDGILLPMVLEHVPASPRAVFAHLLPHLRPGATCVVAAHNLGSMSRRVRALRGQRYLPAWRSMHDVHFSLNWPDLPAYRWYLMHELIEDAQTVGMQLAHRRYSMGHNAYHQTDFFGIRGYLALRGKHWIRLAVPRLREYSVLAFTVQPAISGPRADRTGGDHFDA